MLMMTIFLSIVKIKKKKKGWLNYDDDNDDNDADVFLIDIESDEIETDARF